MRRWLSTIILSIFVVSPLSAANGPTRNTMSPEEVSQFVVIQHVTVKDHVVSGEIVNISSNPIRNVEILIQYHWSWHDEKNPGADAPGRAVHYRLKSEVEPSTSVPFVYVPESPLPMRKDGQFSYEVSLSGFTIVGSTPE